MACFLPPAHAKSTRNFGHPSIFHVSSLHASSIVRVFRMVGWPVFSLVCTLKVREFEYISTNAFYIIILQGSLVDMEQEISRLETALKQKDEQLSSFKTILEQTQAALDDARECGRSLTGNLENLSSEQSLLTQRVEALSLELTESQAALETSRESAHRLEGEVERLVREGEEREEREEREREAREEELRATRKSLEEEKQALREAEERLSERDSEVERVRAELQVGFLYSTETLMSGCVWMLLKS